MHKGSAGSATRPNQWIYVGADWSANAPWLRRARFFPYDQKAVLLCLTAKGQRAMHAGLVGWDDIADVWFADIPAKRRKDLFGTLAALNGGYNQRALDERADRYLKSLRLHETRKRVIADRGKPRKQAKRP